MSPLSCLLPAVLLGCLLASAQGQQSSVLQGFTAAEIACFGKKQVLYPTDGKCYALLTKGPCPDGSWLVLDKDVAETGSGDPVPVCKVNTCTKALTVYWPADKKCHKTTTDSKKLCPLAGMELESDLFGEGKCLCTKNPPHVRMHNQPNGPCYEIHQRGPCPEHRDVVTPVDYTTNRDQGRCTRNTCSSSTERNKHMYGFHAPSNRCYQLGAKPPCGASETFIVSPTTLKLDCVSPTYSIFDIPKRGTPQEIRLAEEEKAAYTLSLISSICKGSRGKSSSNSYAKRGNRCNK